MRNLDSTGKWQVAVRGVHSGVPSFFKAKCWEAAQGSTDGYVNAGWHLATAVGNQAPYDVDLDAWADEVESLRTLLDGDDDEFVWLWFKRHYPRCVALVPTHRRGQFVAGVRRAYEQDRIEV